MNAHDRIAADRAAVERLRGILSNMDPHHMKLQAMGGEMMLTCDAGPGKYAEIAVILPEANDAERDFFLFGPADALAALRVIDRADAYFRQQRQGQHPAQPEPKRKMHGSECAMLCAKEAFGRFMAEVHGEPIDPKDADAVADAVKRHLKIPSRSVLNTDDAAVERWIKLRNEYQDWMRS
jgi:hypothetical protein